MWRSILARDGGDDAETIRSRCAASAQSLAKLGLSNDLDYYRGVIESIAALPNAMVVPIAEIAAHQPGDPRRIALRHDVDADLVAAVSCARICAAMGQPAAFYLLHTSHYYGAFRAAPADTQSNELEYVRHHGFSEVLHELMGTGVEIGLHNDALGVYLDHGGDGQAALREELTWLRRQGVDVRGTAAHNSAAVYGGECFEIFAGLAVENRRTLHWRERTIPLQTLDMTGLGLAYEANHPRPRSSLDPALLRRISTIDGDVLRQPEWQRVYFVDHPVFTRGYGYDAWLIGRDMWLLSGAGTVRFPLNRTTLIEAVGQLPPEATLVISIHPDYVGERDCQTAKVSTTAAAVLPGELDGIWEPHLGATRDPIVPPDFGFYWEREESDLNWYDWMFHYRLQVHMSFTKWVRSQEDAGRRFDSVLEIGCGRGVFYPHYFADRRYVGLEYSHRNTDWLKQNRNWQGHDYVRGDIARWQHDETYDLVFSSGMIDNVPNMDRFLAGMVSKARKSIHLTAYRGWFPELNQHRVNWVAETGAFYNDISPHQVERVLRSLGCRNIIVDKLATEREPIPFETVVIADK